MDKDYSSICSGTGWWTAEYFHSTFHFSRVVVFAIRADSYDDERMEVVGIDQIRLNQRLNSTLKDSQTFRGYVHDSDFEIIGIKLKPEVENYLQNIELPKSERV